VTLVVGRVVGDQIRIVADSLLTQSDRRKGYFAGALKPVILHPGLCVAYAGGAEDGIRALRALGVERDKGFDLSAVKDALLQAHRATQERTDFLIGSLHPKPALIKVSQGGFEESHASWIGSRSAFEKYQEHFMATPGDPPPSAEGASNAEWTGLRMESSLRLVIEDPEEEDVGNFAVRAASNDYTDGFTYLAETISVAGHVDYVLEPGIVVDVPMGGVAEGAYRHALAPAAFPGVGALGLYLKPGDLGLLLHPLERLYAIPFSCVSQEEFERRVLEEHEIHLRHFGTLT